MSFVFSQRDLSQGPARASALHPENVIVRNLHQAAPSPASTKSLIGRTLEGLVLTPMSDILASPDTCENRAHNYPLISTNYNSMMSAFSKMLSRGLSQTTAQITSFIHADLHLGAGIKVMEKKANLWSELFKILPEYRISRIT